VVLGRRVAQNSHLNVHTARLSHNSANWHGFLFNQFFRLTYI
jgi:hypothetical protein